MRTLAIETATEACSVALFDGTSLVDARHEVLGRGHAERLIPMIAELPANGKAERILVSLGPGSFTGVRIGVAAGRALGIAWCAQVLGYPTLALVAARSQRDEQGPVTVCMNGGHGEWFVQNFSSGLAPSDDVRSLTPEAARSVCSYDRIAGNRAHALADLFDGDKQAIDILPEAADALLLPEALLTTELSPIYGRAPDAKLPGGKVPQS